MCKYLAYVQYKEFNTKINKLYLNTFCAETGTDSYNMYIMYISTNTRRKKWHDNITDGS